jgi:mannose-6-phosphate isomerase class I
LARKPGNAECWCLAHVVEESAAKQGSSFSEVISALGLAVAALE